MKKNNYGGGYNNNVYGGKKSHNKPKTEVYVKKK
jgi:hypothetical protein